MKAQEGNLMDGSIGKNKLYASKTALYWLLTTAHVPFLITYNSHFDAWIYEDENYNKTIF